MKDAKIQELRAHCIALQDAMNASRQSKQEDVWLFASFKTFMRKYNEIVSLTTQYMQLDAPVDTYDIRKVPGPYDTTTIQQRTYFDEVYANLSILRAFIEYNGGLSETDALNTLNFLKANLRKAIYTEPETEKVIQDAIESLLIGKGLQKGLQYDRETGRVKVAGKESIPDFIFPQESLALEVKISNKDGKLSKIIDEINADILSYTSLYKFVWFLIYDLGFIRDEDELRDGIEKREGIRCVIVKH